MIHITEKLKRELVLIIRPESKYPVNYTIRQDGTRAYKDTDLLGKELTEKQIIQLWQQGAL